MENLRKILSFVLLGIGFYFVTFSPGEISAKPITNSDVLEIRDVSKREVKKAQKESLENKVSNKEETRLIIESLGVDLPILSLNNDNLLIGAGVMNSVPGEGNYSLAGHNMKDKSLLFGALMDIEEGAEVIVKEGNKEYIYQINETVVVPDTAVHMIEDSQVEDTPIISLMTCYYTSNTGKRFFAIGELVETIEK